MTRFLIIVSILYVSFSVYSFQGVKTLFKASWVQWLYVLVLAFALGYFILKINTYSPGSAMKTSVAISGGVFFSFFVLVFLWSVFMLIEDLVRLVILAYNAINHSTQSIPSRRKFISTIGIGMAALPFGALLYGMVKGRYNYKVLRYTMEYDDLPVKLLLFHYLK